MTRVWSGWLSQRQLTQTLSEELSEPLSQATGILTS
ncbi:hypothetical protein EDD99_5651 [Streptomyces sp. 846.5]|nr:hypothetical protein EDD99_5651 [Streptomyces sp. 846.5]